MFTKSTLPALAQLIATGETKAASLSVIPEGQSLGLWSASADGVRAVATPALVELISHFPDEGEVVNGLAACAPSLRNAWQTVIAARLHEMGQRRDAASLCAAISELDLAAESVRQRLSEAKLDPTGYAEWETPLLGCPAEQGPAFPKLLRAIGRTSPYVEGGVAPTVPSLPDVEAFSPEQNWTPNRLLLPPSDEATAPAFPISVLSGSLAGLADRESVADDSPGTARLRWVLQRPWALLLTQVVFTQEAWSAEQNAGSLSLELPEDQENHFDSPGRVNVIVTRPTGEEIECGSLGILIHRVLRQLGVTLLLRDDRLADLDILLAAVIRRLLDRRIWKYEARGLKGQRSGYVIHPEFSVDCYRIFGAKHFNRGCSALTAALRTTADEWATEKGAPDR